MKDGELSQGARSILTGSFIGKYERRVEEFVGEYALREAVMRVRYPEMFRVDLLMEPLPDCGVHMTIEEFEQAVEFGAFTDDDGCGRYATESEMSSVHFAPSDLWLTKGEWTHVVWFNK